MKYFLGIGFSTNIYTKNPRVKIYIDNIFIDDYIVPSWEDAGLPPQNVYEILLPKSLNEFTIKIIIDNNDNNYRNGFLTKATFVCLKDFYLYPSSIYKNRSKNNTKTTLMKRFIDIKNKFNYPKEKIKDNQFFNLLPYSEWKHTEGDDKGKIVKALSHTMFGSGIVTCKIYKKYGIYIAKEIKTPWNFEIDSPFKHFTRIVQFENE